MRRTSFASMTCSVARALEQIGDGWTLLVIRETFYGTRRFKDFEAELGIASNTLSQRLAQLVTHGILRLFEADSAREYRLTNKGREVCPVIAALVQGGNRHVTAPREPPMRLLDPQTGQPLARMQPRAADGR